MVRLLGVVRPDASHTDSFLDSGNPLPKSEAIETYDIAIDTFGRVLLVVGSRARRWLRIESLLGSFRLVHGYGIGTNTSRAGSPPDDVLSVDIADSLVHLARTEFMMTPIHYGSSQDSFFFATERKRLWALSDRTVNTLQPGQALNVDGDMVLHMKPQRPQGRPTIDRKATVDTAIDRLKPLLLTAFERVRGERAAVLFSGGVDSSLVALLARDVLTQTLLVTCSLPASHDARAAPSAADALGIPIVTTELSADILWDALPAVIYSIERWSRMDVEIALPFFLASRTASDCGYDLVLSGQGPDELFAGYRKHVTLLETRGSESLESELWESTMRTHETNIERDEKAIDGGGCDAFFPYLDRHFALSSLSLPVSMKIGSAQDGARKWIFRRLAVELGLPEEIAFRAKRATQYSCGSSNALTQAVIGNLRGNEKANKKETGFLIQAVLDRIAAMIGFPVSPSKRYASLRFDTEPTSRFIESLSASTRHQ